MLTIVYIHHSGFAVLTDEVNLVFDYWKDGDDLPEGPSPRFFSLLDKDLPLVVFVSHFHKDHLNPSVFSWGREFRDVSFVISKDVERHARKYIRPDSIYAGVKPDPAKVHVMKEGGSLALPGLDVKAFGSTDTGLSYMVEVDGKNIFHAGDLNWWSWHDDTPEEAETARKAFMDVLQPLRRDYGAASGKDIDVLMWPVDPRLGGEFWKGAKLMTEFFRVRRLFPMHFTLGENEAQKEEFRDEVARLVAAESPFMAGEVVFLAAPLSLFQSR